MSTGHQMGGPCITVKTLTKCMRKMEITKRIGAPTPRRESNDGNETTERQRKHQVHHHNHPRSSEHEPHKMVINLVSDDEEDNSEALHPHRTFENLLPERTSDSLFFEEREPESSSTEDFSNSVEGSEEDDHQSLYTLNTTAATTTWNHPNVATRPSTEPIPPQMIRPRTWMDNTLYFGGSKSNKKKETPLMYGTYDGKNPSPRKRPTPSYQESRHHHNNRDHGNNPFNENAYPPLQVHRLGKIPKRSENTVLHEFTPLLPSSNPPKQATPIHDHHHHHRERDSHSNNDDDDDDDDEMISYQEYMNQINHTRQFPQPRENHKTSSDLTGKGVINILKYKERKSTNKLIQLQADISREVNGTPLLQGVAPSDALERGAITIPPCSVSRLLYAGDISDLFGSFCFAILAIKPQPSSPTTSHALFTGVLEQMIPPSMRISKNENPNRLLNGDQVIDLSVRHPYGTEKIQTCEYTLEHFMRTSLDVASNVNFPTLWADKYKIIRDHWTPSAKVIVFADEIDTSRLKFAITKKSPHHQGDEDLPDTRIDFPTHEAALEWISNVHSVLLVEALLGFSTIATERGNVVEEEVLQISQLLKDRYTSATAQKENRVKQPSPHKKGSPAPEFAVVVLHNRMFALRKIFPSGELVVISNNARAEDRPDLPPHLRGTNHFLFREFPNIRGMRHILHRGGSKAVNSRTEGDSLVAAQGGDAVRSNHHPREENHSFVSSFVFPQRALRKQYAEITRLLKTITNLKDAIREDWETLRMLQLGNIASVTATGGGGGGEYPSNLVYQLERERFSYFPQSLERCLWCFFSSKNANRKLTRDGARWSDQDACEIVTGISLGILTENSRQFHIGETTADGPVQRFADILLQIHHMDQVHEALLVHPEAVPKQTNDGYRRISVINISCFPLSDMKILGPLQYLQPHQGLTNRQRGLQTHQEISQWLYEAPATAIVTQRVRVRLSSADRRQRTSVQDQLAVMSTKQAIDQDQIVQEYLNARPWRTRQDKRRIVSVFPLVVFGNHVYHPSDKAVVHRIDD